MFKKIKRIWEKWQEKRDAEYHKRLLNFIVKNAIVMMYCSYILAWFDKADIAESLSNTVASSIVAVTIPYLITKTIENVSKYGCRLNKTTKDFDNVNNVELGEVEPITNEQPTI